MATMNPTVQVPGHVPFLGHKVQIYEPFFAIVLSAIVTAHVAVFIATVFWVNRAGDTAIDNLELQRGDREINESQQSLVSREA